MTNRADREIPPFEYSLSREIAKSSSKWWQGAEWRRDTLAEIGIPGPTPFYAESEFTTWNGGYLPWCPTIAGMWPHEMAHWIVSSPNRRQYPDFALGDLTNQYQDLMAKPYWIINDEHRAVLLGCILAEKFDMPRVTGSIFLVNWESVDKDPWLSRAKKWLIAKGIITWSQFETGPTFTGKKNEEEDPDMFFAPPLGPIPSILP